MKKLETDFIHCIPFASIEEKWGKREYKKFLKWMEGQTCTEGGAYYSDVSYYARQRNYGIKYPRYSLF